MGCLITAYLASNGRSSFLVFYRLLLRLSIHAYFSEAIWQFLVCLCNVHGLRIYAWQISYQYQITNGFSCLIWFIGTDINDKTAWHRGNSQLLETKHGYNPQHLLNLTSPKNKE